MTIWTEYTERDRRLLGQVAQLITDDMFVRDEARYTDAKDDPAIKCQEIAHLKLARELGVAYLVAPTFTHAATTPNGKTISHSYPRTATHRTQLYLTELFCFTCSVDLFMKYRLSFIEIAFQEKANQLRSQKAMVVAALGKAADVFAPHHALKPSADNSWLLKEKISIEAGEAAFAIQISELNERFRQAKIPLSYHNDLIQMSDDALVEREVERPFWSAVSDPKWSVVDQQMKEALDERDRGDRNAVSNAFNALESTIKTISNDKGLTHGAERGAVNYIDNLVKETSAGRFIQVWERDILVKLFGDIRNKFGHGPASGHALPTLLPQQTAWAIDTCMVWIKSLIRRV